MHLNRRRFVGQLGVTAATTMIPAVGFGQQPESTVKHPRDVEQYLKDIPNEMSGLSDAVVPVMQSAASTSGMFAEAALLIGMRAARA